jgi:hypothetical protein
MLASIAGCLDTAGDDKKQLYSGEKLWEVTEDTGSHGHCIIISPRCTNRRTNLLLSFATVAGQKKPSTP